MLTRVPFGNDFTIRINVVQPQYTIDGTIYEDFDVTKCSDVKVCLICEQHKVIIPLSWTIEENTNNIILADIIGKQLHVGSVYGVQITGLDENNKAWRYKNKAVFSVVDATKDSLMDVELMDEPLELRTEISLFVNAIPIEGHQGAQGTQGPMGEQGPAGERGLDGAQGPMGEQGPAGERGLDGAQGPMGEQGPAGQDGSVSFDDLTPEQKEELRGEQGPMGEQGPAGAQGPTGAQGNEGAQGPTGAQGNEGAQGPKGAQGPAGQDGSTGTQGEQGVQGPQGETGAQGPKGAQGPAGQDGSTGPQGDQGPQGETGPQGERGLEGAQGPQGAQGPAGDGADIDIEPAKIVIDEQMPSNPDPEAVYMISQPINITPYPSLSGTYNSGTYTLFLGLYDQLNKKLFHLGEYVEENNLTISLITQGSIIKIYLNGKWAYTLDVYFKTPSSTSPATITDGSVQLNNNGDIEFRIEGSASDLGIDLHLSTGYWATNINYSLNFDPFGTISTVISHS